MLKNKYLTTYLLGYLLIWVGLTASFYNSSAIGIDVAENMAWANNLDIMYDKHPGLGAFFLKIFSLVSFGDAILATVLASGTCALIALIYTYKISRLYFSKEESTLLVIATTFSAFYILQYFLMYNQNIILLPFWVMASYYFLQIQNDNSYKNWILLSIATALGFYSKFEILLLSGIMFLYIVFAFKREYLPKFIVAAIVFFICISPAIIWLSKHNYSTVLWIFSSVSEHEYHNNAFTKLIIAQFYNILSIIFVAGPLLILFIFIKIKRISISSNKFLSNITHPLIVVGLYPLIFFWIAQSFVGMLPDGWALAMMALFLPTIYKLFNLKITKPINLKKLVSILIILQLIIFSVYNVIKYFNDAIIFENAGNSLAIEADSFWGKYNNDPIPYVGGYYYGYYYLATFSKSKPIFLRDYTLAPKNTEILIALEGCNDSDIKDIEESGFKVLHHKCTNIESVNKYKNQKKPISLFIIEKF